MVEKFVEFDGLRLWSVAEGAGPPLVLCHGGPGCCDYLAPVAALLTDRAQVIRYEQRGCGRSTAPPPYTVATSLADLDCVRQYYGLSQWIVAGHSWGADLALLYALTYPARTLGVICLAGGRLNNDREWHAAYSQRRDAGLEPVLDYAYPPNLEVNAQVNRSMKTYIQRPTLLRDVAELTMPALFIYGAEDIRPSWPVEQVAYLLPGARFVLLPAANHYLWQTHAPDLQRLMASFIAEVTRGVSPNPQPP